VRGHGQTEPLEFSVQNSCVWTNDVLAVNASIPGVAVADYYQGPGCNGPWISSVYAPSSAQHPYITLVDGFDLIHLRCRFGDSNLGREDYTNLALVNVFGSVCAFVPTPCIGWGPVYPSCYPTTGTDVPANTAPPVNFLDNVRGNPVVSGMATVHFGLAKADRVEIKVYDVTGRLVRILANRSFAAGEHSLVWDGTNDQGRRVARGAYFTQVKYINSNFVDAKKVTILK
jgi:hypothetical protein